MPNINAAVHWAIEIALDDTHGYSQANRYGPDYDCSSFIAAALIHGGFNVPATMWTGNERNALLGKLPLMLQDKVEISFLFTKRKENTHHSIL